MPTPPLSPPPGPIPPPPPPSFGGGTKVGATPSHSAFLDQIHQGAMLKKAVTDDRSAPKIGAGQSAGGVHNSSGGEGEGSSSDEKPVTLGGLFAGGMPKLKSKGQAKGGGPELERPGSMSKGLNIICGNDIDCLPKDSLLLAPSSTNEPLVNRYEKESTLVNDTKPITIGPSCLISGNTKLTNEGVPGHLNSEGVIMFSSSVDENNSSSSFSNFNSSADRPPPVPPRLQKKPPPIPSSVYGRPVPPPRQDVGSAGSSRSHTLVTRPGSYGANMSDFEANFRFHDISDVPPPGPVSIMGKIYPSKHTRAPAIWNAPAPAVPPRGTRPVSSHVSPPLLPPPYHSQSSLAPPPIPPRMKR